MISDRPEKNVATSNTTGPFWLGKRDSFLEAHEVIYRTSTDTCVHRHLLSKAPVVESSLCVHSSSAP